MKTAIFAHFDKENVIADYVLFYIKNLKKICENVIFVSCCEKLSDEELAKLDVPIVLDFHNEYDFGSYKRGFNYAKENGLLTDELILANDSCYGPINDFENMFSAMENVNCDFWGITKNKYGFKKCGKKYRDCIRPHIQSYFMVFKQQTFEKLGEFLNGVTYEINKNDIIEKYEIGLTEFLEKSGFMSEVYLKEFENCKNPAIFYWRQISKKSPLIKCSLFRLDNRFHTTIENWEKHINDYPIRLIDAPKIRSYIAPKVKIAFFNVIAKLPIKTKFITRRFLEYCMPFLTD